MGEDVILPHSSGTLQSGVFSLVESLLKADLMRLDPATGEVSPVISLGTDLEDPFEGFVATEGGFPLWKRLWAVCGGDELRAYDRVRNQLRGFDRDGNEVAPVQLPATRREEVSPREFAQAVFPLRQAEVTGGVGNGLSRRDSLQLINGMLQEVKGDPAELAAYLPAFADFRCSVGGTMWMRPVDLDRGGLSGGPEWLRIGEDGVVRRVTLPDRFDAVRFSEERVWGVLRDEFDVAAIAWIDLAER